MCPPQQSASRISCDGSDLYALGYTSTATALFTDDALKGLLRSARRFNATRGVTGKLYAVKQGPVVVRFAQWIEGDAAALGECFRRIQADPRHAGIRVHMWSPVAERRFEGWSMAVERVVARPSDADVAEWLGMPAALN